MVSLLNVSRFRFLAILVPALLLFFFLQLELFREEALFSLWGVRGFFLLALHIGAAFFLQKRFSSLLFAAVFFTGVLVFAPFAPNFPFFVFRLETTAFTLHFFSVFAVILAVLDALLLFQLQYLFPGTTASGEDYRGRSGEIAKLLGLVSLFLWVSAGFGALFAPIFLPGWFVLSLLSGLTFLVTYLLLQNLHERLSLTITNRQILVFSLLFALLFSEIVGGLSFLPLPHLTIAAIFIIIYYGVWSILERRLRSTLNSLDVVRVTALAGIGLAALLAFSPWRLLG